MTELSVAVSVTPGIRYGNRYANFRSDPRLAETMTNAGKDKAVALQITWLGHASFKVQNDSGKIVYIDPWINGNPACSIEVKDIDKADIVCVTHGHFDHFGDSLEIAKNTGAKLVCSPDIGWYAHSKGVEREKVIEKSEGGKVKNFTPTLPQPFINPALPQLSY